MEMEIVDRGEFFFFLLQTLQIKESDNSLCFFKRKDSFPLQRCIFPSFPSLPISVSMFWCKFLFKIFSNKLKIYEENCSPIAPEADLP